MSYTRSFALGLFVACSFSWGAPDALHAQERGTYGHYEVYDQDLFAPSEYVARRKAVLEKMEDNSVMLVRSADVRNRSNDVDYEFRQRNNLLYLTGVTEDRSALLLVKEGFEIEGQRVHEVLFVAERDPDHEVWEGIRMGPDVASDVTGITNVLGFSGMHGFVQNLLSDADVLYYDDWMFEKADEPVVGLPFPWKDVMSKAVKDDFPDLEVRSAGPILNELRMIKSPAEVQMMRMAIEISAEGHRNVMRIAQPGMHEYEFEAMMEYTFRRLGAEDPGYPSIVGAGPNTCILHYNTNRRRAEDGDLVLMDCGAEYHGYSADITRTFPVSGTFTPEQRAIYNIVLEAQAKAIEECREGVRFFEPHRKAAQVIAKGLVKLGIMKEGDDVGTYFMHGTSHYLGMDVHDVSTSWTLEPGMVLTVEPGIYIPEGSKCDEKWWNIGIRIEDDILVTDDGPVNLSEELERTADEIEGLMKSMREYIPESE